VANAWRCPHPLGKLLEFSTNQQVFLLLLLEDDLDAAFQEEAAVLDAGVNSLFSVNARPSTGSSLMRGRFVANRDHFLVLTMGSTLNYPIYASILLANS
jgi:hypothetical protein